MTVGTGLRPAGAWPRVIIHGMDHHAEHDRDATSGRDLQRALHDARSWMDASDVAAVGQTELAGEPAVSVLVTAPVAADRFPASLHGVPVVVRDAGGPILATDEEPPE